MFCVIYRFKLTPQQESLYKKHWDVLTDYFIEFCGALGSSLHKSNDNLWVAYSRWPDKETRDASWPGDAEPSIEYPDHIINAIKSMQAIKKENAGFPQYEDIMMVLEMDKLVS